MAGRLQDGPHPSRSTLAPRSAPRSSPELRRRPSSARSLRCAKPAPSPLCDLDVWNLSPRLGSPSAAAALTLKHEKEDAEKKALETKKAHPSAELIEAKNLLKDALASSLSGVADLFVIWDADKSGKVNRFEFRDAVRTLGLPAPDDACDLLFEEYDQDGSGEVAYEEYVRFALRDALKRSTSRVIDLFKHWDGDGSGCIDKQEFRKALTSIGFDVPAAELDSVFDEMDADGSGEIELKELQRILRAGAPPASAPTPRPSRVTIGHGRQPPWTTRSPLDGFARPPSRFDAARADLASPRSPRSLAASSTGSPASLPSASLPAASLPSASSAAASFAPSHVPSSAPSAASPGSPLRPAALSIGSPDPMRRMSASSKHAAPSPALSASPGFSASYYGGEAALMDSRAAPCVCVNSRAAAAMQASEVAEAEAEVEVEAEGEAWMTAQVVQDAALSAMGWEGTSAELAARWLEDLGHAIPEERRAARAGLGGLRRAELQALGLETAAFSRHVAEALKLLDRDEAALGLEWRDAGATPPLDDAWLLRAPRLEALLRGQKGELTPRQRHECLDPLGLHDRLRPEHHIRVGATYYRPVECSAAVRTAALATLTTLGERHPAALLHLSSAIEWRCAHDDAAEVRIASPSRAPPLPQLLPFHSPSCTYLRLAAIQPLASLASTSPLA